MTRFKKEIRKCGFLIEEDYEYLLSITIKEARQ